MLTDIGTKMAIEYPYTHMISKKEKPAWFPRHHRKPYTAVGIRDAYRNITPPDIDTETKKKKKYDIEAVHNFDKTLLKS